MVFTILGEYGTQMDDFYADYRKVLDGSETDEYLICNGAVLDAFFSNFDVEILEYLLNELDITDSAFIDTLFQIDYSGNLYILQDDELFETSIEVEFDLTDLIYFLTEEGLLASEISSNFDEPDDYNNSFESLDGFEIKEIEKEDYFI